MKKMESYREKVLGSAPFYNDSFLSFDFELKKFNYLALKEYFMPGCVIEMVSAFKSVGRKLPECCAEIFVILRKSL